MVLKYMLESNYCVVIEGTNALTRASNVFWGHWQIKAYVKINSSYKKKADKSVDNKDDDFSFDGTADRDEFELCLVSAEPKDICSVEEQATPFPL